MLCQNCGKREARVHFTKIINNQKIEIFLCEQCAKEKGQINFSFSIDPFKISEFFSGLMGHQSQAPLKTTEEEDIYCDKCKMSFNQFKKQGKLGCDGCYEKFEDKLNPLMNRLHGHVQHNGKVPEKISKSLAASRKVEEMKKELNRAIQNEEYEMAAQIRDQIKAIENTIESTI